MNLIDCCERGLIPAALTRAGMRKPIGLRLIDAAATGDSETRAERIRQFLGYLRASFRLRDPVAGAPCKRALL